MPDGNTLALRLSARTRARLDRVAAASGRSANRIASEAVTAWLDEQARQVREIEQALADCKSPDARFVPHEEAMRWLGSLSTDRPLPKPKGKPLSRL